MYIHPVQREKAQADEPGTCLYRQSLQFSILTHSEVPIPVTTSENSRKILRNKKNKKKKNKNSPRQTSPYRELITGAKSQLAFMLDKNQGPSYLYFPCSNSLGT